jgi:GNAT superfamily N-acetyltransferase
VEDRGTEPGRGRPTRVERVDERLGLAVLRASMSARTLVTYARDHVTVRTPSRPDYHDGNTLDLESAPGADALGGWIDRFTTTVGQLGAQHVQLRWEEPAVEAAAPPVPDPALAEALRDGGFELMPTSVLLLERLRPTPPAPAELRALEVPSADQVTSRRWHAATVLYRYEAEEPGPEGWRFWNEDFVAWSVDVQRELAAEGRVRVWLASRHGAPVGRLTVAHDRQGLAVVEDVVVHPVHRRRGIASALTHAAVADHLARHPGARVGLGAEPGSVAERLYARLGFRRHATVWTARR